MDDRDMTAGLSLSLPLCVSLSASDSLSVSLSFYPYLSFLFSRSLSMSHVLASNQQICNPSNSNMYSQFSRSFPPRLSSYQGLLLLSIEAAEDKSRPEKFPCFILLPSLLLFLLFIFVVIFLLFLFYRHHGRYAFYFSPLSPPPSSPRC